VIYFRLETRVEYTLFLKSINAGGGCVVDLVALLVACGRVPYGSAGMGIDVVDENEDIKDAGDSEDMTKSGVGDLGCRVDVSASSSVSMLLST
jgi:hypothetical protein